MSPDAKPNRLGWLQLSILTMVWNKEMYGLEIQKHLKIRGYPIATTQLYSALNNLERIEALKVNVVLRAGASRKYYIATEIGKKLVMDFFVNFLILFQERIWEKFNPFLEDICSKLNGVEGKEIVDFSEFYSDQMFETLISPLAIHNQYNIICESAEVKNAYEDQMKLFDNKDNIFPLKIMEKKTDIPTNSMDYAFCFFSLHAEGYDWIIPEMSRVLRTDGIGIILEINAPEGDYPFLSFLLEFVTRIFNQHTHELVFRFTNWNRY